MEGVYENDGGGTATVKGRGRGRGGTVYGTIVAAAAPMPDTVAAAAPVPVPIPVAVLPITRQKGVIAKLVPVNGAEMVAAGIRSVEDLWHYCSKNIRDALDQLNDVEDILPPEMPNAEFKSKIDTIKSQIDIFGAGPAFQESIKYIEMPPSEFYKTFLGGITANHLGKSSMRFFYERLNSASTQCVYAERYCGEPPTHWDTCYICGITGPSSSAPFECEHILPAFTSLGHYGLIESSLQLSNADIQWYTYEYSNAHQCCNQIKSDTKWIVYDTATKLYKVDYSSLIMTLQKIWKSGMYDCVELQEKFKKRVTMNNFVKTRAEDIYNKYLYTLLNKINNMKNSQGETYHLLMRSRQLNALNLTYDDVARALMGAGGPVAPIREIDELIFTDTNVIQKHYLTQLNQYIGSIFVEILMNKVQIVSEITRRIEIIKAMLEVTERISARKPDASIKQHIEDPNRPISKLLKQMRDRLITESMSKLTIGPGVSETVLNVEISNVLNIARTEIEAYIQDRLIAINPSFGVCAMPKAKRTATLASSIRRKTMIGGAGLLVNKMLFDQTPIGFDNPFSDMAEPPMVVYSEIIKPIDPAIVLATGRVSKPVLRIEEAGGGRAQGYPAGTKFITDPRLKNGKVSKYIVKLNDDGMKAIGINDNMHHFNIFGLFDHVDTWTAENSEGHQFKARLSGGKRRFHKRKSIRKVHKRQTQRKRKY